MKGYTEGETYPTIIASEIRGAVDHVHRGDSLKNLDFDVAIDEDEIRKFTEISFDGCNHLFALIDYIGDRYIGKVIVPGQRKTVPYPRFFPNDPEFGLPPKTRTKADIKAFMANAQDTITPDEIVEDIEKELEITIRLGDVEGFNIDTSLIKLMIEGAPKGWQQILKLMRHTTDRYVGDMIVSGSQGVDPWPRREL